MSECQQRDIHDRLTFSNSGCCMLRQSAPMLLGVDLDQIIPSVPETMGKSVENVEI